MAEDTNKEQKLDLSELAGLQFATAWTPSSTPKSRDFSERKRGGNFRGERSQKQNRENQPRRQKSDYNRQDSRRDASDKKFRKNGDLRKSKGKKFEKKAPFEFSMEVLFYPDDAPIEKLSKVMKASKRTYQLFDIAHLVLEKQDRFIVLAKNLPDANGELKPLYCAQPYNIPFEDEQSAKSAALEYYIGEMFEKTQQECEAPKGNFQVVNRSKITGDLLGAPNWHRYNEYLREYHREKCSNVPFEKFVTEVEGVRDEAEIAKWTEQMKTRTVYKLKEVVEGENDTFETREAAVAYIAQKKGAELVKKYDQVRFKGANISKMPFGRIRKNIEEAWRKQKRFPIVTANNLRGRLRRTGFAVYKRGTKGFAFVSAIKRKFLFEGDSLAEAPQKIFDFITANAGINASELPYKFLGMEVPETSQKPKPLSEEANSDGTVQSSEPATSAQELSEEVKAKLGEVWRELTWLISEGYVVEYADATLQANPYLARPKDKSAEASAEPVATADEPILKSESSEAVAEEDDETSVEEEVLQEAESAQEEQVEESENKAE